MKSFLLVTSVLALTLAVGCGKSNMILKKNGTVMTQAKMMDITDTSNCEGATPSGASIKGTWYALMKWKDVTTIMTLTVGETQTTFRNECFSSEGVSITTESTATSHVTSNTLETAYSKPEKAELGKGFTCTAGGKSFGTQYELVGPCLKFINGQKTMLMVPDRPNLP